MDTTQAHLPLHHHNATHKHNTNTLTQTVYSWVAVYLAQANRKTPPPHHHLIYMSLDLVFFVYSTIIICSFVVCFRFFFIVVEFSIFYIWSSREYIAHMVYIPLSCDHTLCIYYINATHIVSLTRIYNVCEINSSNKIYLNDILTNLCVLGLYSYIQSICCNVDTFQ